MSFLVLTVLVCFAAAGIVVYAPSQIPTKALPESKDPALVSRSRELAAWNDPRTWRGVQRLPAAEQCQAEGARLSKRRKPLARLRDRAAQRQGHRCFYCGHSMRSATPVHPESVTADHVVPRAAGGRTTASNIVACCRACNQAKGCEQVQVQVRTDTRSRCDELGPQRGLGEEPW